MEKYVSLREGMQEIPNQDLHVYNRAKRKKENDNIKRDMNEVEAKAESHAIDSMVRFDETMKLIF